MSEISNLVWLDRRGGEILVFVWFTRGGEGRLINIDRYTPTTLFRFIANIFKILP